MRDPLPALPAALVRYRSGVILWRFGRLVGESAGFEAFNECLAGFSEGNHPRSSPADPPETRFLLADKLTKANGWFNLSV
jgi:hypothetical protein